MTMPNNTQSGHETLEEGSFSAEDSNNSVEFNYYDKIRSIADPLLIRDERVLRNVLRLDKSYYYYYYYGSLGVDPGVNPRIAGEKDQFQQVNYFKSVQREIKPHMRKIVTDWMMEV